jgi:CRISPR-associated DxTHG motif protein
MSENFVLISFLGDTDYKRSEYNFRKLKISLPFDEEKGDYLCSFEAIKDNIDLEKIYLFLTKEAKERFEKTCDKDDGRIEIKKISEKDSFDTLLEKFLKTIREIVKDYENTTIIIDLTHSFRHFTMLKLLSTLMANFLLDDFKFYIVYAKEIDNFKYEFIELNEYIDYYEFFQAVEYFIDDLYVPEFFYKNLSKYTNKSGKEKTIEIIFKKLFKLGKSIRENVIEPKNEDAIWDLAEDLLNKIESLEEQINFLKEVNKYEKGKEFKEILKQISELKYKEEYQKLIDLAELTFNKKLLLNSAVYLMEGMSEFVYWKFKNKKILKIDNSSKTPEEFEKRKGKYKVLNCLKNLMIYELLFNGSGFYYKPRCSYDKNLIKNEISRNLNEWENFAKKLKNIDEIRNNMAHVFRDESPKSYEDKIAEILSDIKDLIKNL